MSRRCLPGRLLLPGRRRCALALWRRRLPQHLDAEIEETIDVNLRARGMNAHAKKDEARQRGPRGEGCRRE
jgi:hypothetical protein